MKRRISGFVLPQETSFDITKAKHLEKNFIFDVAERAATHLFKSKHPALKVIMKFGILLYNEDASDKELIKLSKDAEYEINGLLGNTIPAKHNDNLEKLLSHYRNRASCCETELGILKTKNEALEEELKQLRIINNI